MSEPLFSEHVTGDIRMWSINGRGFALGYEGDPLRWVSLSPEECRKLAEVATRAAEVAEGRERRNREMREMLAELYNSEMRSHESVNDALDAMSDTLDAKISEALAAMEPKA